MKENKKIVSIIVPIYNVEKYIEKCIESIIKQTYANLEIILINDGSVDNSEIKYKKYLNDKRIKEIKQKNQGLSGARNTGIKAAKGDYIMFVDSDDWIDEKCVEYCIKELEKKQLDIVIFPYVKEYGNYFKLQKLFSEKRIFQKNEIQELLLKKLLGKLSKNNPLELENLNTAWGKLYKASKIKNKEFIDTKIIGTEDCWFNIETFFECEQIQYIENCFYHYRKEDKNSLTRKYNINLFEQWCRLYEYMENFIKNKKLDGSFYEALNDRIIINLISLILNILNSDLTFLEQYRELNKLLNYSIYEDKFQKFEIKKFSIKWKFFFLCARKKRSLLILILSKIVLYLERKKWKI